MIWNVKILGAGDFIRTLDTFLGEKTLKTRNLDPDHYQKLMDCLTWQTLAYDEKFTGIHL